MRFPRFFKGVCLFISKEYVYEVFKVVEGWSGGRKGGKERWSGGGEGVVTE